MKKAKRLLAVVVAVCLLTSVMVVFAACDKTFTVSYYNGNDLIGTEKVQSGKTATGQVSGWSLSGGLKTADGEDFDLKTPITADISLYGNFTKSGNYTYRVGPSELPTAWNSHTAQSASTNYILDFTTEGLYSLDYSEDFTTFRIVPSMASDFPTDVTADYVGRFGVVAGDTDKVYRIPLKTNLKFDNGEVINANSFVRSVRNLLNPQAANFRADELYAAGDMKIYGAEAYAKQNSYALSAFVSENYGAEEYINPTAFTVASDLVQVDGKDIVMDLNSGGNWGANGLAAYAANGDLTKSLVMDEETGRVKIFDTKGVWILTRSLEEVEIGTNPDTQEPIKDYEFFDLDGNKLQQRYVNDAGTAWVYLDKDGNIKEEWAGCRAQDIYIDAYQKLLDAADEKGWVKLTSELVTATQNVIAHLQGYDSVEEYAAKCVTDNNFVGVNGDINYAYVEWEEMAFFGQTWAQYDFEDVGFFADGDNALVIVLVNPMEDNFYLRRSLCTDFYLVYNEMYERLADTSTGVYTNSYGTSMETYVGFGPYKLVSFLSDSKFRMEKNPHWHGYSEPEMDGLYQTTAIEYIVVKNDATRLEMFLKGELDSYGLQAKDMADYVSSDYTYFQDSESTWYVAMNPDVATYEAQQKLAEPVNQGYSVIKTPMAIFEFRQALSYSLDRAAFNLQFNPTGSVAKGLLSSEIISDPDKGEYYRGTDEAKDALLSFWGLEDEWGEGKEYATRDEAIASITGYDIAGSKALFDQAYDKAVEAGYITTDMISSGKWEVQILLGIPVTVDVYTKSAEFLAKNWTEAVKGTKFEGHLTFKNSQELGGTTFGNYLRNGTVDMLWLVGYQGDQFNPYSMMDVYSGKLQYDPLTDKSKVNVDIELDGKLLRATLSDWIACLQNQTIQASVVVDGNVTTEKVSVNAGSSAPTAKRVAITAKCETAILNLGNLMPLSTDASAILKCMRIQFKTEDYILGIGRGGLKYNTYTMTDEEFAAFVKAQGGTLNYK